MSSNPCVYAIKRDTFRWEYERAGILARDPSYFRLLVLWDLQASGNLPCENVRTTRPDDGSIQPRSSGLCMARRSRTGTDARDLRQ